MVDMVGFLSISTRLGGLLWCLCFVARFELVIP
jgi:hypothetical protein